MSTLLNFGRDVQGLNAYAPQFSTDRFSVTLSNGNAQSFTVPSNYKVWNLNFSYQSGTEVWVSSNNTASAPSGSTFASTTSSRNPASRTVFAGDVISCLTTNSTANVGVELYAIP